SIAQKYGTTTQNLMKINNLRSTHLKAGQILKVSGFSPASSSAPRATYHRVRQGETLSSIAQKYGTTTQNLMKINNLRSTHLKAGQILKVSGSSARSSPERYHVVQKGESLWSIAKKYKTTPEKIEKINKLKSSALQPGQKLLLP
ncbi:MAG: LysM peptidoglycan-binding domain-containing protein, partial [Bacteroidia bacterium]